MAAPTLLPRLSAAAVALALLLAALPSAGMSQPPRLIAFFGFLSLLFHSLGFFFYTVVSRAFFLFFQRPVFLALRRRRPPRGRGFSRPPGWTRYVNRRTFFDSQEGKKNKNLEPSPPQLDFRRFCNNLQNAGS
jgi:hypothetical protein